MLAAAAEAGQGKVTGIFLGDDDNSSCQLDLSELMNYHIFSFTLNTLKTFAGYSNDNKKLITQNLLV